MNQYHPTVTELLDQLSNLEPNWDGGAADPVSNQAIEHCRRLLAVVGKTEFLPEITPNPNGTVTLDWDLGVGDFSLEFGATQFSSCWTHNRSVQLDHGNFDAEAINLVIGILNSRYIGN